MSTHAHTSVKSKHLLDCGEVTFTVLVVTGLREFAEQYKGATRDPY